MRGRGAAPSSAPPGALAVASLLVCAARRSARAFCSRAFSRAAAFFFLQPMTADTGADAGGVDTRGGRGRYGCISARDGLGGRVEGGRGRCRGEEGLEAGRAARAGPGRRRSARRRTKVLQSSLLSRRPSEIAGAAVPQHTRGSRLGGVRAKLCHRRVSERVTASLRRAAGPRAGPGHHTLAVRPARDFGAASAAIACGCVHRSRGRFSERNGRG